MISQNAGFISVGAVFFTQPLDLVKNRMQMSGELYYIILYIYTVHTLLVYYDIRYR